MPKFIDKDYLKKFWKLKVKELPKTENYDLDTEAKTIVGAINELAGNTGGGTGTSIVVPSEGSSTTTTTVTVDSLSAGDTINISNEGIITANVVEWDDDTDNGFTYNDNSETTPPTGD